MAAGLALVLLAVSPACPALDEAVLTLGRVDGEGWHAEGVTVRLGLGSAPPSLVVEVPLLALPPPLGSIGGVRLRCPGLTTSAEGYRCDGGTAEVEGPLLDRPALAADLAFDPASGVLSAALRGAALAGGELGLTARRGREGWELDGDGAGLDLANLVSRLAPLVALPSGWGVSGRGRVRLRASGTPSLDRLTVETSFTGAGFTDGTGRREGQGLAGSLRLDGRRQDPRWAVAGMARLARGEVYLEPVYVAAGDDPLEVEASGTWASDEMTLDLDRVAFRHPRVLDLEGRALLGSADSLGLRSASVRVARADLGGLYEIYLQPYLQGTPLDRLVVTGTASGVAQWEEAGPASVRLDLQQASALDRDGRFGLRGLAGTLRWRAGPPGEPSTLGWAGGNLFRIPFGAAAVEAVLAGSGVRLTQPLDLPVLGGSARVDRLEATGLGSAQAALSLEGLLTPLSMEALSAALGWPGMGGTLSGVVPRLEYAGGRLQLAGALLVRVFDGEVVIRDLVLERPLGVVPKLAADVDVRGLDLEALTRAFSFGSIRGRLGGTVRDLRLERWMPVAFDARLQTPADDRSRRRISQRAVESLASLGGAGGVVSRALFGIFEEFPYRRLGIACRLRDGVCEMDGVAPADGGYYIVEGGGVPRIDVVGYNRRVDWQTLLERLRNATRSGSPQVQ